MSPHNVTNFVTDLVEMAKATERLPIAEHELSEARQEITTKADTIQRLELKLMDAHNLEASLRASIRDLEVARDDAELRFLELDERAAKAVRFLGQVQGMAVQAEIELNPPKPEPTPEPMPIGDIQPQVSEVKPIAADPTLTTPQADPIQESGVETTVSAPMEGSTHGTQSLSATNSQGQSDPLPTPAPTAPTGTGTESVASDTDPEPTKYDHNGCTTSEWITWWLNSTTR